MKIVMSLLAFVFIILMALCIKQDSKRYFLEKQEIKERCDYAFNYNINIIEAFINIMHVHADDRSYLGNFFIKPISDEGDFQVHCCICCDYELSYCLRYIGTMQEYLLDGTLWLGLSNEQKNSLYNFNVYKFYTDEYDNINVEYRFTIICNKWKNLIIIDLLVEKLKEKFPESDIKYGSWGIHIIVKK